MGKKQEQPNPADQKIGARVRRHREAMPGDVTQGELGHQLGLLLNRPGVTQSHVSRYERGVTKIPMDVLEAMAKVFGCRIEDITGSQVKRLGDPERTEVLRLIEEAEEALVTRFALMRAALLVPGWPARRPAP